MDCLLCSQWKQKLLEIKSVRLLSHCKIKKYSDDTISVHGLVDFSAWINQKFGDWEYRFNELKRSPRAITMGWGWLFSDNEISNLYRTVGRHGVRLSSSNMYHKPISYIMI